MGRKNKKYVKSLHQQAHEKLVRMQAFGDSRAEDKKTGADREKIYSYKTYTTYHRAVMRFIKYVQHTHPECTSLKHARKYVNIWLQSRVDAGLSSWTVSTEVCALSKLYNVLPDDERRFHTPPRHRADIQRSRTEAARDRHFSQSNNAELVNFVRSTGTRRNVLQKLRGDDLWFRDRMIMKTNELREKVKLTGEEQCLLTALEDALSTFHDQAAFLLHARDKGGKTRFAPIVGSGRDQVIARMQNTPPDQLVWQHVHSAADIHNLRAQYCQQIYRLYARDIRDIPYDRCHPGTGHLYQSGVYHCRDDERGKKLDRAALYKASKALGHNRIDVIPNSYLYGL